MKSESRLSYI